jgi:hypothetical protein
LALGRSSPHHSEISMELVALSFLVGVVLFLGLDLVL